MRAIASGDLPDNRGGWEEWSRSDPAEAERSPDSAGVLYLDEVGGRTLSFRHAGGVALRHFRSADFVPRRSLGRTVAQFAMDEIVLGN
jgi:hypothetical protein